MAIDGRTRDVPPIRRDAVYTIAQFCRCTGKSRTGLRQAERRGLETFLDGGRKYISGEAYHSYLRQQKQQQGEQAQRIEQDGATEACELCGQHAQEHFVETGKWAGRHVCTGCWESLPEQQGGRADD